jgi:predicted RNase H-like HicB family nuclease
MKVYIHVQEDRNGFFVAEVPEMPGCFSQGRTPEEALAGMRQVIEEWYQFMAGEDLEARCNYC